MTELLKTELRPGVDLYIEAVSEPATDGVDPALLPDGVPAGDDLDARKADLEKAVEVADAIATKFEDKLVKTSDNRLTKVGLEIGLGFTAKGGIILVGSTELSVSLKVTLEWTPNKGTTTP